MIQTVNSPASAIDWKGELNTTMFDTGYIDTHRSAIDSFMNKNKELNLLILDPGSCQTIVNQMIVGGELDGVEGRKVIAKLATPNVNYKLMNLVLLGYVSAVEGYFRQIIRELVNLDSDVKANCRLVQVNFGATYYGAKEMLPESLMDGVSFTSKKNIINTCKNLLDIPLLASTRLAKPLEDFDSICQLRHCVVHRFGKVGATNAIKLGLHGAGFNECIEKPIAMSFASIQKASKVSVNLIKVVNQYLWEQIMKRSMENKSNSNAWSWDYRKDKKLFKKYIGLFYETTGLTFDDSAIKARYVEFRNLYASSN